MHSKTKLFGLVALGCLFSWCQPAYSALDKNKAEVEALQWANLQIPAHAPVITEVRKKSLFNEGWLFQLGDNPKFREISFQDDEWRQLHLPHDWSIESAYNPKFEAGKNNGFFNEGIAWYRKHFKLGKEQQNKQLVIQFDGVFANAEVYLNGHYLGRRPNGYSTFRFDLTDKLKFDPSATNVLAVRVDNSHPGATRWYNGSGIYRNVYLLETNYVHFRHDTGVHITMPVVEKEQASIDVKYNVLGSYFSDKEIKQYKRNRWDRSKTKFNIPLKNHVCILRSTLYDKEGNEVAQTQTQENIRNYTSSYSAQQAITVKNPVRWSDKNPYLYYLKSELIYEGKVLDDVVTTVGIRKLEFRPNEGLFVNGKETYLKGVCLHHAAGALGAAVPMKVRYLRLLKLKEMGCNAIRTSHNPYSPDFFALCDAMGIYVMDEAFDEWQRGWNWNYTENPTGKAMAGYDMIFDQWWKTDLQDQIRRDRNHPSVVMYSVGNEIPQWRVLGNTEAVDILNELLETCKSLDPTRSVAIGNNEPKGTSLNGVNDALDVLGFNYIERDFGDSIMYGKIHEKYPNKLCFGSETKHLICYWNAIKNNPYVFGQFIWTGFDYLGETAEVGRRGARYGLMDLTLQPKETWAQMKACWREDPQISIVTSLKPHDAVVGASTIGQAGEKLYQKLDRRFGWNWAQGQQTYVIIYNNCDYVKLYLDGHFIGQADTNKKGYFSEFKLPFSPGHLQAVGYINHKPVCHDDVTTTGDKVTAIQAKAVWNTISSTKRDQDIIEISLVDKKGRTVFAADNAVTVTVSGGARLIALDSGDLYYEGYYTTNTRKAYRGKLLLTIESTLTDAPVKIKLSSKGLPDKIIEIPVK